MSKALPTAPAPLIDIGVNLTNKRFNDDLDAVLERARAANIGHLLVTGTDLEESDKAAALSKDHPGFLSATAGVHPHHAKDFSAGDYATLKTLAQTDAVKAIGECGLDYFRMFSPERDQLAALERQIELASELGLPLFLHERDAHRPLLEVLTHYRDAISGGVVHCFTGSREQAFRYLDLDLYLGITGWICDERRGYHLHEFIADIPTERLLIETDAPYLMPRVKPRPRLPSSSRNEPCTLPYVLMEIARHHHLDSHELAQATTTNACRLFTLTIR